MFTSAAVQAPLLEFRSYLLTLPAVIEKLFFNQFALTAWQYLHNLTRYASVEFFFLTGSPHGNHGIGNVGQFYLFELPLVIVGMVQVMKRSDRARLLLLGWTISTIAIASLTRESPHATRSFFLLLPMGIFSATGLLQALTWLRPRRIPMVIGIALVTYNLLYYFSSYYRRFPIFYAKQWRATDKQLALFLKESEHQYDRVLIDPDAGFIYTSLLFYQSYPPQEFLLSVRRAPDDSEGFSTVETFGKYEFRPIRWEDYQTPKTLIVTTVKHKPEDLPILQSFSYPERPVVIAVKQQIAQYPVKEAAYVVVASRQ